MSEVLAVAGVLAGWILSGVALFGALLGLVLRRPSAAVLAGWLAFAGVMGAWMVMVAFGSSLASAGMSPEAPGPGFWAAGLLGAGIAATVAAGAAWIVQYLARDAFAPFRQPAPERRETGGKS